MSEGPQHIDMSEKQKHLATFQNILVMANADGDINEQEIELLAEMARGMGLNQEEFGEKVAQVNELDFIIPEDEAEREHELRMVVLTMITDGNIDPREYKSLLRFAESMEIEQEYVDTVVNFYVEKQKERLENLNIFQNLYIVAAADGQIGPKEAAFLQEAAETLGLLQSDIDYVSRNVDHLELIIPEDEEEAYYSLRNLVYMMIIDGEIDDKEMELCVKFAESIGYGEEKITLIITEYESLKGKLDEEWTQVWRANVDIYLDLFLTLDEINIAPKEVLRQAHGILNDRNFDALPFAAEKENRALYELIWICTIRAYELNRDMMLEIPLQWDLVIKTSSWRELQSTMLQKEEEHGETAIPLLDMKLSDIQNDLKTYFRQLEI